MRKHAGCAIVLASLLAGCVFEDMPVAQDGVLETTIGHDGSKQFVYRVPARPERDERMSSAEAQRARDNHANDGGFNGRNMRPEESGMGRRKEGAEKMLAEQAKNRVAASGYCRKGFITIETSTDPLDTYLRGECEDAATDADRKKFR